MPRRLLGTASLAASCMLLGSACPEHTAVGMYGTYPTHPMVLHPPQSESLVVYRVQRWQFTNGTPPALQLEYEAITALSDTSALRAVATRIWPAFVPLVEEQHLGSAIITATTLHQYGSRLAWAQSMRHFSLIAHRDAEGSWRLDGVQEALPPPSRPDEYRIMLPDGRPMLSYERKLPWRQ